MQVLKLLSEIASQLRLARADTQTLRTWQSRRLRALAAYAYRHSAYYRERFDAAGLRPDAIGGIDDLTRIPITDKKSLQQAPREQLLSSDPLLGKLTDESSSGSTGTPFATAFDSGYVLNRNVRFLRGLWAAGYRWPMRLLLITGIKERPPSRWMRWHYASIKASAAESLKTYERIAPQILYGCVTPLRELAQRILQQGSSTLSPRSVITTAETLDQTTRELLQRAFGCEVFDFYGMTEMGLVGWECRAHNGYHLALDSVLVEQLPLDDDSGRSRLVYTNLALHGMPLLRYQSGDIGHGYAQEPCPCGSRLPRLLRVEGREVDAVVLPDGSSCSPYQFTCELEKIAEIQRYKVIQVTGDRLRVLAAPSNRDMTELARRELHEKIATTINKVTGATMLVEVELVEAIAQIPGTKFRVVENQTQPPAAGLPRRQGQEDGI